MSTPKNPRAPHAPYFTPLTSPATGTAITPNPPTLFQPLKIRDVTFQNRIWVAPMCQYSADDGALTDYHLIHLGAFAFRGSSLTIIEATAVRPEGRISPEDAGLWKDSQKESIQRLANFVHSQAQKLGIQLAHAGRKASTVAPWLVASRGASLVATNDVGGWTDNVVGPSAIRWGEGYVTPREMTQQDIFEAIEGFRHAARRAVEAGVDVIEIHGAHGYLITSFLSPLSNTRTDKYGGSFANRTRFATEIIMAVRSVMPAGMPLLFRISATEWMEHAAPHSWDIAQTIEFAKMLHNLGVDLLDVSSGGNNAAQKIQMHNDFQVGIAGQIRAALRSSDIPLLLGAVGMITEAEQARDIVGGNEENPGFTAQEEAEATRDIVGGKEPTADVVLIARQFMREPEWVLRVAWRLGVEVQWPVQYGRGKFLRGSKI
ncbi:MAG: hypothetical protein M1827_004935 [Pycnora praestabilis]|nr:MAG: hypothetical protein M1827_004935 [Pycnora praestabilis]